MNLPKNQFKLFTTPTQLLGQLTSYNQPLSIPGTRLVKLRKVGR